MFANSSGVVNSKGPVLEFDVEFTKAGVYTVWARGWAENLDDASADDTMYFGVDGKRIASGSGAELRDYNSTVWWICDTRDSHRLKLSPISLKLMFS